MGKKTSPASFPKQRRADRARLPALTEEGQRPDPAFQTGLVLLSLILFYSPFLRGLFFQREQEFTLLLACLAFAWVWMGKLRQREVSFLGSLLDYLVIVLVFLYLAGIFWAANQRLAAAELVKMLLYFLVYWMASQLGREERHRYFLLSALYAAGVGVAAAGVLTAQGVVSIKDGFVGGRIYSTLQYPNALASYLTATSLVGWLLWAVAPRAARFVLAGGTYLTLAVLLATGSRGALFIYPLVAVVFFLGVPREFRKILMVHAAGSWASAFLANSRFLSLVTSGQHLLAWWWLALGLAVALAVQTGYEWWARASTRKTTRVGLGLAVAGLTVAGGFLVWLTRGGLWFKILPPQLLNRLQDVSLETFGAATRIQWSLDAMKLVKARPFFGYGGGAWEAAYQSYQSYYYTSTQVHNHYFQIWTEVGTVGLAVFLGIWVLFFITAMRNYRKAAPAERLVQWTLLAGAVSLGLHAVLDFDLALSAVALALWTFFGLTRGIERKLNRENRYLSRREYPGARSRYLAAVLIGTLAVAWLPATLALGSTSAKKAVAAVQNQKTAEALRYFRRASLLDPFNASYRMDLASLLLSYDRVGEAVDMAEKAAAKAPFDRRVLTRLGEIYWRVGKLEEAVGAMRGARDAAPWIIEGWENLSRVAAMTGIAYLNAGDKEKAKVYLEEAAGIPELVHRKVFGLSQKTLRLWKEGGRPLLQVTPAMELNAGIGLYGLGRFSEALKVLERPLNHRDQQDTQAEAYCWASLAHRQLGNVAAAEELRRKAESLNPELAKSYEELAKIKPL